jgi:glycosyltransferase involved in cell wall biosynthesis
MSGTAMNGSAHPRVSIVTPSFEQGRYLADAIESVLAQDYPNLEHSVIDGGSGDGSVQVLERYAKKLASWVSEPDEGQAHALNKGFARATGEVFGWLNADDTYEPGAVRAAIEALAREPEVDVVSGRCRLWYGDERDRLMPASPLRSYEDFLRVGSRWMKEQLILQPEAFFRRRAYEAVGGVPERWHYAMDVALWMAMARNGCRFANVDAHWANLRMHPDQKTADPFVAYAELCRLAWTNLRADWDRFGPRAPEIADDIFDALDTVRAHDRARYEALRDSTSYRLGRAVTRWRFW